MSTCMGGAAPYHCPENPCAGCPHVTLYQWRPANPIPHLCPVCAGSGWVDANRWMSVATSASSPRQCHACGGRGVVFA